jgi:hypothetical protein|tara:strand:+ start:125 stop:295 length:171 start_codon:yes stop_codon:yes gene_type:complete
MTYQSGIMRVVPAELRVAKKSNMFCISEGHCSGRPPAKLTICKKLTEKINSRKSQS